MVVIRAHYSFQVHSAHNFLFHTSCCIPFITQSLLARDIRTYGESAFYYIMALEEVVSKVALSLLFMVRDCNYKSFQRSVVSDVFYKYKDSFKDKSGK